MRTGLLALAAAACAAPAAAQQAAAQVPHPPPPPSPTRSIAIPGLPPPGYPLPNATIARFWADPPRCGERELPPVHAEEPFPAGFFEAPERIGDASATLTFRIDRRGRPLSISEPARQGESRAELGDLPAALAVWRFAPGRDRRNCSVRFRIAAVPLERADLETLYRFVSLYGYEGRPSRLLTAAAFRRLMPAGSDCMPAPRALNRPLPDTARFVRPAGTAAFTMLAYDLDAGGAPVGARVVASSGHESMDGLSLAVIANARWSPGVRKGCLTYYYSFAPLPAAELPPDALARLSGRNCPGEERLLTALPPAVAPPAFRARPIGGWAALRYDVLEGGAIGSAEAVASEPAAAFGIAARALVTGARISDAQPATGCLAIVRFPIARRAPPPPPG